ncbi:glycosyltransferase [Flavobacterium praedii]|uniref:glycosyltransferase n=1 Tax=Flavobacterium praedii TaxID=3002900 RepID=UPI002481FDD5|nr:glycosyltransferase [Flavobacterium praedii]
MTEKRLVSMFYFDKNVAGKDMFLVPKYLNDYLGMQGEIVYPINKENIDFNDNYRGMKLTPIKSLSKFHSTIWSEKEMTWWLIKNAKRIDVLCLFWLNQRNVFFAKIYKLLNSKGICYIKGDLGYTDFSKPTNKGFRRYFRNLFLKAVDVYSVETEVNYEAIKQGLLGEHLRKSTVLMSNGFDAKLFEELNITKREFNEKENLLITVGRLGTVQKNNEMMLEALDGVDMHDWKFMLIGSVEEKFLKTYNEFILKNPDKKEKVIITGAIYDRAILLDLYNKSKLFVLTSTWEGMANVFPEALAFGNYILTTNVSGAKEISDNGKLGKIIKIGDIDALRVALCDVFKSKVDLETNYREAINFSDSSFNWRQLVTRVGDRIIEINLRR